MNTASPSVFTTELENFRIEEESAQQFFLGYLALQRIPASNTTVLDKLNDHPTFWITARYALLVATFVALGRIFDQDKRSIHNIDKLLRSVSDNLSIFCPAGLCERRVTEGMDVDIAAEYAREKYALSIVDVRDMRKAVAHWRNVYEVRYRDIRHLVFAHRGISREDADLLMAKAKVDEMQELLGFLEALYTSLWELYVNGRKPDLIPVAFSFPPIPDRSGSATAGERVYRQALDLMFGMLDQ